jgi:hypothetical protein
MECCCSEVASNAQIEGNERGNLNNITLKCFEGYGLFKVKKRNKRRGGPESEFF